VKEQAAPFVPIMFPAKLFIPATSLHLAGIWRVHISSKAELGFNAS
jgi:hypothetical protein